MTGPGSDPPALSVFACALLPETTRPRMSLLLAAGAGASPTTMKPHGPLETISCGLFRVQRPHNTPLRGCEAGGRVFKWRTWFRKVRLLCPAETRRGPRSPHHGESHPDSRPRFPERRRNSVPSWRNGWEPMRRCFNPSRGRPTRTTGPLTRGKAFATRVEALPTQVNVSLTRGKGPPTRAISVPARVKGVLNRIKKSQTRVNGPLMRGRRTEE
jgi:hypothetical protein